MSCFFLVMILFFFAVDVTVVFPFIYLKSVKNAIDYINFIHATICDENSHRMSEERSTNNNRPCNLY